jgi:hypothetical protein
VQKECGEVGVSLRVSESEPMKEVLSEKVPVGASPDVRSDARGGDACRV